MAPYLLSPISQLVGHISTRRSSRSRSHAGVPVLCCGNLTVGGTGKTTLAIDIAERLKARGIRVHLLTRGYRGRLKGPVLVDRNIHTARDVGDEALLLAETAPTWVGGDRAQSARMAVVAGAQCLVMDDGFQNPGLYQDLPLLVIDGETGFGNGRVLPAGPLREPLAQGIARARAAIIIGRDRFDIAGSLKATMPVLKARLNLSINVQKLVGQQVIAFAGLARPSKFFDSLKDAGIQPVRTIEFPDHHTYSPRDNSRLLSLARQRSTRLVTTPKDAVKLTDDLRRKTTVVGVTLQWEKPDAPEQLIDLMLHSHDDVASQ